VPHASAVLFIGQDPLCANVDGSTLVPSPDLVLSNLVTDAEGGLILGSKWPPDIPRGTTFYLQMLIRDPATRLGQRASNALSVTAR
jgi:hypothetical protein